MKKNIVYILTNPDYEGSVKIGYTDGKLRARLQQLNNTGIRYPFKCVYACKIKNAKEVEKKLHDYFKDKRDNQSREFFQISVEEVIKAIQLIDNDLEDITKSLCDDLDDLAIVRIAEEIKKNKKSKVKKHQNSNKQMAVGSLTNDPHQKNTRSPFNFEMVNIPIDAEITFLKDKNIRAKVIDNRHIFFKNQKWTTSKLAADLLGKTNGVQGPCYWEYKGEILDDRRKRLGK